MRKLLITSLVIIPLGLIAQPKRTLDNGIKKVNMTEQDDSYDSGNSSMPSMQMQNGLQWMSDYSQGMQRAKKENKPVFLYFTGSDWCGWCKKLDQEALAQPEFSKAVGDRFVFIKLDFPMNRAGNDAQMQQNTQLKQKYGVTGFPTVILLDPNGTFIAETGYRSGGAKAYASYIQQLIQPTP